MSHEFVYQGVVCPVKPRELSGIKRAGIFLVPLLFFFLLKNISLMSGGLGAGIGAEESYMEPGLEG